eukprot:6544196-Lingulodinium_polyedra.AAC.1
MDILRDGLWTRTLEKLAERVALLLARAASPATRAVQWNTHEASMLIYPAHIDSPTLSTSRDVGRAYARAGRTTGWAPSCILGAIT